MDRILLLAWKSYICDIKFQTYVVSKSIPAAKSKNFVDSSGAQKCTCPKFLESDFYLSEKIRLYWYH